MGIFKLNRLAVTMLKGLLLIELASLCAVMAVVFAVYRPQLQRNTLEDAVAAGERLATQIEIAVRSVEEYSDFYVQSPELLRALADYEAAPGMETLTAVKTVLTRLQPAGDANVRSALVLGENVRFTADAGVTTADLKILNADWIESLMVGNSPAEFAPFYAQRSDGEDNSMMYLRAFTGGEQRYILGLVCDTGQLIRDVRNLSDGLFSGYALASTSGPAFFTAGELSDSARVLERHTRDGSFLDQDDTGYYIASSIPTSQWRILGYLSNENFNARFRSVLTSVLLLCLLVCALTMVLVLPFSQWLLRPVGELRDAMEQATQGALDVRVAVRQDNEIGQLGGYFNHMLEEIRQTRTQELEAQRREQQVRYDLLTSQINAHYIYNTMSSVNSLARLGRCEDVVVVNSALIRILQNSLHIREGELFTTVGKGLETVRSYWSIETVRPNNHATFRCEVEDELLPCPLLKNILQPLVENSLRHGLMDEVTGEIAGEVVLSIRRAGEHLRITVTDNGRGIPPERLVLLNHPPAGWEEETRHIGLANIRKRLEFAYEGKASLQLFSSSGTTVELLCPLSL